MRERPLRTTTISELVPLGPADAVEALDVHRFEGVVAGLWGVEIPGLRLTFIGIPTRRPYLSHHDVLSVAVRVARRGRELVGEVQLRPFSTTATEVALVLGNDAGRRTARWFDAHVADLRPVVQALRDGVADAARRVHVHLDLFDGQGLFQAA
jgi:hypothetical protein